MLPGIPSHGIIGGLRGIYKKSLIGVFLMKPGGSLFPEALVEIITWDRSDHSPILLSLNSGLGDVDRNLREDERIFRFEARWL